MTMHVKPIADELTWVSHCHTDGEYHIHLSQYVLESEHTVLIDAGAGNEHEMEDAIRNATTTGTVDALLLTHSVLPHTKNVGNMQAAFEGIEVITSSPSAEAIGIQGGARPKILNDTESVADRTFSFLDPLMTDAVVSNWIYDHDSKTLFTAEGVGHYHDPDHCAKTSADMDGSIEFEHVHAFHADKLPYLGCVDPDKLRKGFQAVFDEFDVDRIAPMHGNPVEAADISAYIETILTSVDKFEMATQSP